MLKLAIVSRDYFVYERLFAALEYANTEVELIYAGDTVDQLVTKHAEIILSEPDVAARFIHNCSTLRWLQSTWAGNNALQHIAKRDYLLSGTKGIFTAQMREYVFAYILYFQRQIAKFKELQSARCWTSMELDTLVGKRIGIMGLGSIGCEIALTAQTFGMHISAITARNTPLEAVEYFTLSERLSFVKDCDYVLNLLPETHDTKGVCDDAFFATMKQSAVFLNAGRGSILLNDQVIIDALNKRTIYAAVLDVFEQEPLSSGHPFYQLKHCYITNHTAAKSAPEKVFSVFTQNLQRFIAAQPLLYEHDFTKGY